MVHIMVLTPETAKNSPERPKITGITTASFHTVNYAGLPLLKKARKNIAVPCVAPWAKHGG